MQILDGQCISFEKEIKLSKLARQMHFQSFCCNLYLGIFSVYLTNCSSIVQVASERGVRRPVRVLCQLHTRHACLGNKGFPWWRASLLFDGLQPLHEGGARLPNSLAASLGGRAPTGEASLDHAQGVGLDDTDLVDEALAAIIAELAQRERCHLLHFRPQPLPDLDAADLNGDGAVVHDGHLPRSWPEPHVVGDRHARNAPLLPPVAGVEVLDHGGPLLVLRRRGQLVEDGDETVRRRITGAIPIKHLEALEVVEVLPPDGVRVH